MRFSRSTRKPGSDRVARRNAALLLVAPPTLLLGVLFMFPFVYALILSFQNYNMARTPRFQGWAGFSNYAHAFTDPGFINSTWRTIIFVVFAVGLQFLVGFALAFVLNQRLRGMPTIRKFAVIPVMVMPIVTGLIFFYMFNQRYGVVNWALGTSVPWLTNGPLAMLAIVIADFWQWTPFIMLVVLAGLHSLPEYVYEAAQIDGLTRFQTFRKVTLPLLAPVLLIVTLLRVMDAFKVFDIVYQMTSGGPAGATETMSYYIYRHAFQFFDIGYAAAMAILMLVLILLISQIFVRWLQKREATTS